MRHNPYGARVTPNQANRRVTMVESDPRQASLFAAAWMIGYVAATAEAALQTLTVGSLTGCLGLARVHAPGELLRHPAFYAARGLAELGGNLRYQCHSSLPGSVAAVAGVDREGRPVLWLANLTGQKQEVVLQGNHQANSVLLMDELGFTGHGADSWHQRETAKRSASTAFALRSGLPAVLKSLLRSAVATDPGRNSVRNRLTSVTCAGSS